MISLKLDIPEGKINTGQGEYIVFHNGEKREVDKQTYKKVYQIFNRYANKRFVEEFDRKFGKKKFFNFRRSKGLSS